MARFENYGKTGLDKVKLEVGKLDMNQPDIIICAYGSRAESAGQGYGLVEKAVTAHFPGHGLSWAYTGRTVRRLLAEKGAPAASPAQALARLAAGGRKWAALFSLHLLAAAEYDQLLIAARGDHGLERVAVSRPLLSEDSDFARLARLLQAALPPERQPGRPVILAGHGTAHPAGRAYARLGRELARLDKDIHLALLEHGPGLAELLPRLEAYRPGPLWLMPLLVTAGVHAGRDLLGPGPGSWQSRLTQAGFQCLGRPLALAGLEPVRQMWLDRLAEAVRCLETQ